MHLGHKKVIEYLKGVETIGKVNDNGTDVVMCHFPMAEWKGCRRSKNPSFHVYSHIHNRSGDVANFMYAQRNALNSGCMINNYEPCSLDELIENNRVFINGR